MMKRAILLLALLLPSLPLYGAPIKGVATIYPLTSIVASVGGERVTVDTLVPPGASPHDYELRPSDLRKIQGASFVAMVGDHLDDWLEKALKGKPTFVLAREEDLIGGNPHIWLDPTMVKNQVTRLVAFLSREDPGGANYYQARGREFMARLERVTRLIRQLLTPLPCKEYIAQHGAWLYFGERFGLECLGVVEEVPGREPGPRRFMELVSLVRSHPKALLITDRGENPRVMEVLANEGGILVRLDPIGDPGDPERSSLIDLLLYNARRIVHACARR